MADKEEDAVKQEVVNEDDTKQEGVSHKAVHQEDAKQEGIKEDDTKQEGVTHQEDDQQEDIDVNHIKQEVSHQEDVKQEPEAAPNSENIVLQQNFLEQAAELQKQREFLEQFALVLSAKKRYYNPPTGIINPGDPDYIDPEELDKLIDLDIGPILPNLYISQASCSIDPAILQERNITSIISITTEFMPEWESPAIRSRRPPLAPSMGREISAKITSWCTVARESPGRRRLV